MKKVTDFRKGDVIDQVTGCGDGVYMVVDASGFAKAKGLVLVNVMSGTMVGVKMSNGKIREGALLTNGATLLNVFTHTGKVMRLMQEKDQLIRSLQVWSRPRG